MEKKGKCYCCREYRVYYIKGARNFIRQNVGYCALQRLPVDADDGCADWQRGKGRCAAARLADGLRTLREAEENLAVLRQMFREMLEEQEAGISEK